MIAGCLHVCGAYVGPEMPHHERERSMYEYKRIVEEVERPYLESIGADPLGQYPLPDTPTTVVPPTWRDDVLRILEEDGYDGHAPWVVKSSRTALIWHVWHYAFPHARWVIVRRRTGDIIDSCMHTQYMRAMKDPKVLEQIGVESERDGWLWWVRQHERRFVQMIEHGLDVKILWPERMVYADFMQLYELTDWLGLDWTPDVLTYIDPKFLSVRRRMRCRIVQRQRTSARS